MSAGRKTGKPARSAGRPSRKQSGPVPVGQIPVAPSAVPVGQIEVVGARTHNLKSVNVVIPHERLTVISGPSGCGKSSLAMDTIFAEGQRQYVETLSVYARQFIHQLPRADVDRIDGLEPTLRIDQHSAVSGNRSTVGTVTGIHDYLRLLFSRIGIQHCHRCGQTVTPQSPERIAAWVQQLPEASRVMLLAPLVRARKGKHAEIFERIRKERLVRCRVDGAIHDIDSLPELDARQLHSIEAVTDRLVIRNGGTDRLQESLALCLNLGEGTVLVAWQSRDDGDRWQEQLFSTRRACADCGISYPPVEPNTFSFNSPQGACPECQGLGSTEQFLVDAVFPDRERNLEEWAREFLDGMTARQRSRWLQGLEPLLKAAGVPPASPLAAWKKGGFQTFWDGVGTRQPGLKIQLEKLLATAARAELIQRLESMRGETRCAGCQGSRLKAESLSVRLAGLNLAELAAMPIGNLERWIVGHCSQPDQPLVSEPLLQQVRSRLKYLLEVGLDYLTLDRAAHSLSGGEYQRVRLAAAIGNDLTRCCFVLDEPSIGLHPRDNDRLIGTLRRLCSAGNTVIVVEHDEEVMRAADHLIDMGPSAGRRGGQIVASGTVAEVAACAESASGRVLAGVARRGADPVPRPVPDATDDWIVLTGARGNNLQSVTARIPTGRLTVVSGVSGSGKSTLIHETLIPALQRRLGRAAIDPAPFDRLEGGESIQRVVPVDQRPLGRNPRGCPATYTGVMDDLRKLFASTREAKRLGFGPERFSFNSASGWCPECQGLGQRRISMKFLPDLFVTCEACQGTRYHPQSLQCRFRGATIGDVLKMEIGDVAREFASVSRIHRVLATLVDVGLGYLPLGQPTTTLSGGECQRMKLATELVQDEVPRTLFVLDEPTTGLHFEDVRRLISILHRLVDQGHTLVVIEHHLDLVRTADWILDLGPEGGVAGGQIVVSGTTEAVRQCSQSHTGAWLRRTSPEVQAADKREQT